MKKVRFRAWIKSLKAMADVLSIDYEDKTVLLKGHKRDTIASFSQVDLLQYTGLKDKNGVEIYEGDILELNVPTYRTTTKTIDDLYDAFILDNNIESSSHIEVIGNIYEDKELKEQNKCKKLI